MAEIVFQSDIHYHFQRGIQQIVNAVRPTLGPIPRQVAISRAFADSRPELLDDGGTIARRIIELPHRTQNSGAMFVRHLLWRVRDEVGDGTATTAVIFETLYKEGLRFLAAGGNAMLLCKHLEQGANIILTELDRQTLSVEGAAMANHVAESISHDAALSAVLGEIFDVIGPFGQLEIRTGHTRGINHKFVDGTYWHGGLVSKEMARQAPLNRRRLTNAAILVSDLEIDDPHDLIPLMKMAVRDGVDGLVIVAQKVSDQIKQLLMRNEKPDRFDIIAVLVPGAKLADQPSNLEDLALLAGAKLFLQATGDSLHHIKPDNLGFARRVWADSDHFGIVGGHGDAFRVRKHVEALIGRYYITHDTETRQQLQHRIGRMRGGTAILSVGGVTDSDIQLRKALAERTATALRGTLHDGVLPGGGVALRQCQTKLYEMNVDDVHTRAACRMLATALEAPMRTILANAGCEPSAIIAHLNQSDVGFDVMQGRAVNMVEAGIFDSAAVIKTAIRTAVHGAALVLTTDVVIHQDNPPQATTP